MDRPCSLSVCKDAWETVFERISEMRMGLPLSVAVTMRCRKSEHPLKLLLVPLDAIRTHVTIDEKNRRRQRAERPISGNAKPGGKERVSARGSHGIQHIWHIHADPAPRCVVCLCRVSD
jgi:hypothetical protein